MACSFVRSFSSTAAVSFYLFFFLESDDFFIKKSYKVAVLGGAGGIGQPLSLLLKQNTSVTKLAVFDIAHAKGEPSYFEIQNKRLIVTGVASDLSHINTPAQVGFLFFGFHVSHFLQVTGHVGDAELPAALEGADVVVIPAGVPRKPGFLLLVHLVSTHRTGMTRDDLFNINAGVVKKLSEAIAKSAIILPNACNNLLGTAPRRRFASLPTRYQCSEFFVAEFSGELHRRHCC